MHTEDIEISVDDWISKSFDAPPPASARSGESTQTTWGRHQELRGLDAAGGSDWRVSLMQQTLAQLGRQVKDDSISSVVADGVVGPKTVAAVNKALHQYVVIATQHLKSGTLSAEAIQNEVVAISGALAGDVLARGAVPSSKTPVAKKTLVTKMPDVTPTFVVPEPWYVVHKTKLMIGGGVLVALGLAVTFFGGKSNVSVSDY